ncbi:MAG TPA: hypothetical protein VGC42_10975 [Kofleriaceae bacterium]
MMHSNRPRTIALGAALLASLTGLVHADPDRALHLAIHGAVDRDAVGTALAAELGVEVVAADGACNVPCLDVAIEVGNSVGSNGGPGAHRTATVLFSPREGQPRTRSVALGAEPARWPTVITLLAGNLVRDEAQDVLAGLPDELDAPAASTAGEVPAAPAEPTPERVVDLPPAPERVEHRPFELGLFPALSTDLLRSGQVHHAVSLDLLVGVSRGSARVAVSGVADVQRGPMSGVQLGGVATYARDAAGTQVAGVTAVAAELAGVQIAGVAAVASRAVRGVQVAGVAAVSSSFANIQVAGVASIAGEADVQVAGVTNVAHGPADVQVAGAVNVAGELRGLQLAPINVAHGGDGVQVGVINVGGSADGFAFGLINIVPGGRTDLESSIDSSRTATLLFRHGGRRWHNVYGIGGHPVSDRDASRSGNDDVWMYGLGFGPSFQIDHNVIDLEAIAWQVNHGPSHERDVSLLAQARLSVEHRWGAFGVVAGLVYNTYITDDHMSPLILERRSSRGPASSDRGVTVERWPSAFIGIRI